MNRTYKTSTNITVHPATLWCTLNNPRFVHDFFPEISRDLHHSLKYFSEHKQGFEIKPSYAIPNKRLHWQNNLGLSISLARKDLPVTINFIEISLQQKQDNVVNVEIAVDYDTKLGSLFLLSENAIKDIFDRKLAVLQEDLASEQVPVDCLNAIYN